MQIQQAIEKILNRQFTVQHLQVINESFKHNVPPGSESHFQIVLVSTAFNGKTRMERHRAVMQWVSPQTFPLLHALSLKLYTPEEWQTLDKSVLPTPPCLGGES